MDNVKILYMAFFIFLISVSQIFGADKMKEPTACYVYFNDHSYVCFNESQFIHDPDCRCSQKLEGCLIIKKKKYPIILYRSIMGSND